MKYFLFSILAVFAIYYAATNIPYDAAKINFLWKKPSESVSVDVEKITKCETDSGKIIYGTPPPGVVCKKKEKIGGNLSVTKFDPPADAKKTDEVSGKANKNMERCLENDVCREMKYNVDN